MRAINGLGKALMDEMLKLTVPVMGRVIHQVNIVTQY
jgi:hypothetical protein